jgi:hypothetical protein
MKSSLHSLVFKSQLSWTESPSLLNYSANCNSGDSQFYAATGNSRTQLNSNSSKVKVTLRLTVSQSVILGVEPHMGLMTRYLLVLDSCGWGALSDERTGLSFVYVAGPRQRSLSPVRIPWDSWPYVTVSDLRLPFSSLPTTRRVTVEVFDSASAWDPRYIASGQTRRKHRFLYCCVLIHCCQYVLTSQLRSNERGADPQRTPLTTPLLLLRDVTAYIVCSKSLELLK